jgi:hypothetical protein
MANTATALFVDRHAAHMAVEQLVQAGFPRDAISVAMSEDTHEREFAAAPRSDHSGVHPNRQAGVLGAIAAGLVVFAAPGTYALRVGGPLVTLLLRASGLVAALMTVGLTAHDARVVAEELSHGSIVIGVHATHDLVPVASQLLELSGGVALQAA